MMNMKLDKIDGGRSQAKSRIFPVVFFPRIDLHSTGCRTIYLFVENISKMDF